MLNIILTYSNRIDIPDWRFVTKQYLIKLNGLAETECCNLFNFVDFASLQRRNIKITLGI